MILRTLAQPSMTAIKLFSKPLLFWRSLSRSPSSPLMRPKSSFFTARAQSASGDHEFKAGSHLLAKHFNAQKKVPVQAFVHAGWPEDESILDDADAIVIYADGTSVIGKGWEKMDQLVRKNKVGVVFMHYAVHPSVDKGEQYYLPWIGGFFKNGVSVNPFWRAKIKPMKGHETARGVGPIDAVDEFYFNIEYHPEALRLEPRLQRRRIFITLTTYGPKKAFSPKEKNNRCFGESYDPTEERSRFTGGHHHRNWAIDGYRTLVMNTIAWAAGVQVPPGGVPTYSHRRRIERTTR